MKTGILSTILLTAMLVFATGPDASADCGRKGKCKGHHKHYSKHYYKRPHHRDVVVARHRPVRRVHRGTVVVAPAPRYRTRTVVVAPPPPRTVVVAPLPHPPLPPRPPLPPHPLLR